MFLERFDGTSRRGWKPVDQLQRTEGEMRYDLPVPVVLLFEPNPPKPLLGCWLLVCPNPEKDMMIENIKDARKP